jgi:hypothetical protein
MNSEKVSYKANRRCKPPGMLCNRRRLTRQLSQPVRLNSPGSYRSRFASTISVTLTECLYETRLQFKGQSLGARSG